VRFWLSSAARSTCAKEAGFWVLASGFWLLASGFWLKIKKLSTNDTKKNLFYMPSAVKKDA
jgi:hypothetical protein